MKHSMAKNSNMGLIVLYERRTNTETKKMTTLLTTIPPYYIFLVFKLHFKINLCELNRDQPSILKSTGL